MKILQLRVLRGPNRWSTYRTQLIEMKLDLEESEYYPTNTIDGFSERLEKLMPSLYSHRCSEKRPGGFLERVKRGTWMGHVAEHIALELQSLAGMPCGYGRTREAGSKGIYYVVFAYQVESAGLYAAKAAIRIVEALESDMQYEVERDIHELTRINRKEGLGPSTLSIINAAKRLGIPYRRLDNNSLVMLGQGANQKLIKASMVCTTSSIGVDIASDKEETKKILADGFIPVPEGVTISSKKELQDAIHTIGFPLVIKPLNGNQGRGISTDLQTAEAAEAAFEKAQTISKEVIAERFIRGYDYRFLVINFKLEAVARRTPAMVIGDDKSPIGELINNVNAQPERGEGHEKVLTKIKVDAQTNAILIEKNLTLNSVLPFGEILFLKDTANLSTGGTARDATDVVHPYNIFLAERIARLVGLDICGIDVIAENIAQPLINNNGAVLEVNAAPGFRMHLSPSKGTARDVGEPVIKMLYPPGTDSRIPVIAVTGTNGKTTTTRLIAHITKYAGYNTGFTTTDGIYINEQPVHFGDCSGPGSAETVLRDPIVDFAVFETARGGILRSGLGFDKCDISVITNITEDHLGIDGIETIEDLAKIKKVVAESTFDDGFAILNADDDTVYDLKEDLDCNIALFSTEENNERVAAHCENGCSAAIIEKGYFTICKGEWRTRVAKVKDVPLTMEGKATCMIKNVLPAILAASLAGIDIKLIRKALQTFIPGPELTPGRMNIFPLGHCKVMVDYVHNTDGFKQLKEFMSQVNAEKKIGIVGCAGDRRDKDIIQMGQYAAEIFDEIIIRHDKDGRGRTNEELTSLITEGIRKVKQELKIDIVSDEIKAIEFAIEHAGKGSFIVVSSDDTTGSIAYMKSRMQQGEYAFADM
jgi:cyanophycin synthetase